MHLNLLAITIKKQELLELGLNLKYMILPINMELVPLSLEISNNVATIILGVKIHSFIYANVHKHYMEGFLCRYFLGKYTIKVQFNGI